MKPKYMIVGVLAGVLLLSSCKKDDSEDLSQVHYNIQNTGWTVSYYYDKDKDETSDYSGYLFHFNDDMSLTVTSGSNVVKGTYSLYEDDHMQKLEILLPETLSLGELNDDWQIISSTSSKTEMKDESGSGGTEYLTFIR